MPLESFALAVYLAGSADRPTTMGILAAIFALQFGIMLILQRIFRGGSSDDDEPGSDGGGPGRRRDPPPRRPPPESPVCWPEFERQFAEYVAGLRSAPARLPAGKRQSPGSDDAWHAVPPEHDATPTP